MGLDDMVSTESAFVAAATAAVLSPRTRGTIRKGAVYGIAGALKVGDVVAGAARGVVHGVRGEEAAVSDAGAAASAGTPAESTSPAGSATRARRSNSSSEPGGSRASARRAAATARSAGSAAGS
ncbi:MAG TPA: hypothetical protein VG325_09365 [Solirubrobacteraceae bacterium]|nr:hypothetical protein [Solirubrobacteraceae bacterium]